MNSFNPPIWSNCLQLQAKLKKNHCYLVHLLQFTNAKFIFPLKKLFKQVKLVKFFLLLLFNSEQVSNFIMLNLFVLKVIMPFELDLFYQILQASYEIRLLEVILKVKVLVSS